MSSTSTASSIQDTLREKTSAQIVQQVKATLQRLNVPAASSARLIDNKLYTPADLLIMTNALSRLKAGNTQLFIARAAEADTRDVAFFQRRRAELLAVKSGELGGIVEFVSVGTFPLNRHAMARSSPCFRSTTWPGQKLPRGPLRLLREACACWAISSHQCWRPLRP